MLRSSSAECFLDPTGDEIAQPEIDPLALGQIARLAVADLADLAVAADMGSVAASQRWSPACAGTRLIRWA